MTFRMERILDDVGWRILAALQGDARLSFSAIGRRVGLSPPAVAERVRRMEDVGVITGYRVALDPQKLGFPVTAVIRLSVPQENCAKVKAFARDRAEVLECHHVTGSDSFVLKVVASSVADLEATIESFGRYGTTTTSIILSSPVTTRAIDRPPARLAARGWTKRRADVGRGAAKRAG